MENTFISEDPGFILQDDLFRSIETDLSQPQQEEENILIQLTDASTKPLKVLKLEYTSDLPEYPSTDPNGYGYVINVPPNQQRETVEDMVNSIQYCVRQNYRNRPSSHSSFLGTSYTSSSYRCSGIKICEYAGIQLKNMHHTHVTDDLWTILQDIRQRIHEMERDTTKDAAYRFYRSAKNLFKNQLSCYHFQNSCQPKLTQSSIPNPLGGFDFYVRCINAPSDPAGHYTYRVPKNGSVHLQFLEGLLNNEIIMDMEECGAVESIKSKSLYCAYDHPQGPGKLVHAKCNVTFHWLIPTDLSQNPYFVFMSHGVHTHVPPPPRKAPAKIMNGILQLINQARSPSLTLGTFLKSPALQSFCAEHNCHTIQQIHESFSNMDPIQAVIRKQRLLHYPAGQNVNGVMFELGKNKDLQEYIHEVYQQNDQIMIICILKEQAELLHTLSSIEIDMSFKRVQSKEMKEVVFATYLADQKKIMTLCRVFTTEDTTEGYYILFKKIYHIVYKLTGKRITFRALHGTGLHALVMDMDNKQIEGLAQFLMEIDPDHHSRIWLLKNVLLLCRVHFLRGIRETLQTHSLNPYIGTRMAALLECESEEDYHKWCDLLIKHEHPAIQNWARHKKSAVIAAGLNKYCSLIPHHIFDMVRKSTNAVEQTHNKSNRRGKQLTLLQAILESLKLDIQDVQQNRSYNSYGLRHRYATQTLEASFLRHMARSESARQTESNSPELNIQDQDQDHIFFPSSSSGRPLQRTPSRRGSISRRGSSRARSSSSQVSLQRVATANSHEQYQNTELQNLEEELKINNLKAELLAKQIEIKKRERELRELELENGGQH